MNTDSYDDILHLPHPTSKRHPRMPLSDRAAQFAPFAALTGHEEAIRETARLTDSFVELDEGQRERLDKRLQLLRAETGKGKVPPLGAVVRVTYFQPDARKEGGAYMTVCKAVKKVDGYGRKLLFADGTAIPIENIVSIEGELLKDMED